MRFSFYFFYPLFFKLLNPIWVEYLNSKDETNIFVSEPSDLIILIKLNSDLISVSIDV